MAIQQHPIPQNVTTYQFRLVGDMTLKQFLQLAGGVVVGLLIYASGLPFFFKWPLVGLAVGMGAGMAFLPVGGRPFDQWLISFFRSIYQPTIYVWNKTVEEVISTPPPKAILPQPAVKPVVAEPVTIAKPASEIPIPKPVSIGPDQASASFTANPNLTSAVPVTPKPVVPPPAANQAGQVRRSVTPLPIKPIRIEVQEKSVPQTAQTSPRVQPVAPISTTNPVRSYQASNSTPIFSSNLPIPSTPQTPNIIVGMTLTPDGKILESAIVEIKIQGNTVRATKSNKLGQFLFLKPLDNNTYQLTAEKDGFTFPTFSLMVTGNVIQPIKLQATAVTKPALTALPITPSGPKLEKAPFVPPPLPTAQPTMLAS